MTTTASNIAQRLADMIEWVHAGKPAETRPWFLDEMDEAELERAMEASERYVLYLGDKVATVAANLRKL